jgi:hypothetical protein
LGQFFFRGGTEEMPPTIAKSKQDKTRLIFSLIAIKQTIVKEKWHMKLMNVEGGRGRRRVENLQYMPNPDPAN